MKPVFIQSNTIGDAYFQLLIQIWEHGRRYKITDGSFAGSERLEFDFASGIIEFPHTKPLAPIMPQGVSPTTTDDKIEEYFINYLMNPELAKNEEYKYATWINGQMLPYPDYCRFIKCEYLNNSEIFSLPNCKKLNNKEILECPENKPNTQLEWIINTFNTKGHGNNHCYITVGDKHSSLNYDIPWKEQLDRRTSPCLRGLDFKIKDGKLITSVVFRSWDLMAGFPENIGVESGPICFNSAGLHCYSYQLEPLKAILHKD